MAPRLSGQLCVPQKFVPQRSRPWVWLLPSNLWSSNLLYFKARHVLLPWSSECSIDCKVGSRETEMRTLTLLHPLSTTLYPKTSSALSTSWLSTLPIQEWICPSLSMTLLPWDSWIPSNVPVECACGKSFSVEHALSCAKGGFPSLRHNEVRDITASLISEVCSNVCTEPTLNPVSGQNLPASTVSSDGARLDVAADGFWGSRNERAFFDVRVFNPLAEFHSLHSSNIQKTWARKEAFESRTPVKPSAATSKHFPVEHSRFFSRSCCRRVPGG